MEQAIVQALEHYAKQIPSAVWGIVLRIFADLFLPKKPAANQQNVSVNVNCNCPSGGTILPVVYGLIAGLLLCFLFCPRQSAA